MHFASVSGETNRILALFHHYGGDPTLENSFKNTPINMLAETFNKEALEYFLQESDYDKYILLEEGLEAKISGILGRKLDLKQKLIEQ
tara:strand:- start:114 stop:377 length:264 start_codon:yes stop_codon:yes gene_type:complete